MVESALKKSELESKAKQKMFRAKLFLGLAIAAIVVSIIGSFYIVETRGEAAVQIAEVLQGNRRFGEATKELEGEVQRLQSAAPKYDLAKFLPAEEQLTTLTRQFDNLFASWNTSANPIVNNSIVFGNSVVDQEANVSVLPVTLSLTSSVENFDRFLQAIETSGLPGSDLRLMDMQSISLNLDSGQEDGMISYTVNINAYFQS